MLTRYVLTSTLLATALIAGGCGSSNNSNNNNNNNNTTFGCADLCADYDSCASATQVTCTDLCTKAAAMNTAGGCTTGFDDFLTCLGQHQAEVKTKICSVDSTFPCGLPEGAVWLSCVSTYCNAHTTDPGCVQLHNIFPT